MRSSDMALIRLLLASSLLLLLRATTSAVAQDASSSSSSSPREEEENVGTRRRGRKTPRPTARPSSVATGRPTWNPTKTWPSGTPRPTRRPTTSGGGTWPGYCVPKVCLASSSSSGGSSSGGKGKGKGSGGSSSGGGGSGSGGSGTWSSGFMRHRRRRRLRRFSLRHLQAGDDYAEDRSSAPNERIGTEGGGTEESERGWKPPPSGGPSGGRSTKKSSKKSGSGKGSGGKSGSRDLPWCDMLGICKCSPLDKEELCDVYEEHYVDDGDEGAIENNCPPPHVLDDVCPKDPRTPCQDHRTSKFCRFFVGRDDKCDANDGTECVDECKKFVWTCCPRTCRNLCCPGDSYDPEVCCDDPDTRIPFYCGEDDSTRIVG